MKVKLKAVHGRFSDRAGGTAGPEIDVTRKRFVIGSGANCHLCCKSPSVSELHCELIIEGDAVELRDLSGEAGTFVNGERIADACLLVPGDHLRVGKLEFELVVERDVSVLKPAKGDEVDNLVSDLLVKADQAEREQKAFDPNARMFKPEPLATPAEPPPAEPTHKAPPPRKEPGKLPRRPGIEGKDTVDAAQKALERLFDQAKKKTET